ncbi:MAG: hypothetical protein ABIO70_28915 [Pseudomonadota bacterium]
MLTAPPPSLHVYRGHAPGGIGEGEGWRARLGEQFIFADPPLDLPATLAAIRPWFTLDAPNADHRAASFRLVAWTMFQHDGFHYVVRLCSTREYQRYYPRDAYFAHGRVWPVGALGEGFDPGVFLGRDDRFDPPWPEYQRTPAIPEGDTHVPLLDEAAEAPATHLLAALYTAMLREVPLVLLAPLEQFTHQAELPRLVALARLGLPWRLKERCGIRLYSDLPGEHLSQEGLHLLALPSRYASEVMRLRPDAVVLEWAGAQLAGPALDPACCSYADSVFARFARLQLHAPDSLLAFSTQVDRAMGSQATPSEPLLDSLVPVFNIAFARATGKVDDLLRDYLVPNAVEGWGGLPAEQLLTATDMEGVSTHTLTALLLDPRLLQASVREARQVQAAGAPQLLRRLAESELAQRSGGRARLPEAQVRAWWASFGDAQTEHLAYLRVRGLVTPQLCAELSRGLPLDTLLTNPSAAAVLLQAEARAPGSGQAASSALAERLGRERETLLRFMETVELSPSHPTDSDALLDWLPHACLEGHIPALWLAEVLELAPEPAFPLMAQAVANAWWKAHTQRRQDPANTVSGWEGVVRATLDRLLSRATPSPNTVGLFARFEARFGTTLDLGIVLRIHEISVRSGLAHPRAWCTSQLETVVDPAQQRFLVASALDPAWQCLGLDMLHDSHGALQVPAAWLPNVLDLLAHSEALLGFLDAASLCVLWQLLRQEGFTEPLSIPRQLALLFAREPGVTTRELICTGLWYDWITGGHVTGFDLQFAALCWLGAPQWRSTSPPAVTRGAWDEAMRGLGVPPVVGGSGGLSERDIVLLTAWDGGPSWPWCEGHESSQFLDLARRCGDLPTLLGLCGLLWEGRAGKGGSLERIEHGVLKVSLFAGVSVHALTALSRVSRLGDYARDERTLVLPLDEVAEVLKHAGSQRPRAIRAFRFRLINALMDPATAEEADAIASDHDVWSDLSFVEAVREWLAYPDFYPHWECLDPGSTPLLLAFEAHADVLGHSGAVATKAAHRLRQMGLHRAARALTPEELEPPVATPPALDRNADSAGGPVGDEAEAPCDAPKPPREPRKVAVSGPDRRSTRAVDPRLSAIFLPTYTLLIAAIAWLAATSGPGWWRARQRTVPTATPQAEPAPTTVPVRPPAAVAVPQATDLDAATQGLFQALEQGKSGAVKMIFDTQLKMSWGRQRGDAGATLGDTSAIAWGLLTALWESKEPGFATGPDTCTIYSASEPTISRALWEKWDEPPWTPASRRLDGSEHAMVAWWFCQFTGQPSLPATRSRTPGVPARDPFDRSWAFAPPSADPSPPPATPDASPAGMGAPSSSPGVNGTAQAAAAAPTPSSASPAAAFEALPILGELTCEELLAAHGHAIAQAIEAMTARIQAAGESAAPRCHQAVEPTADAPGERSGERI